MKSRSLFQTMLCVMTLSIASSCSAMPVQPPRLADRRFPLHPDKAALVYRHEECVKKFLGICTKTQMVEEIFDLNDAAVRKQFIDMGVTCTSERRWQ